MRRSVDLDAGKPILGRLPLFRVFRAFLVLRVGRYGTNVVRGNLWEIGVPGKRSLPRTRRVRVPGLVRQALLSARYTATWDRNGSC
jgi:hypothetical protein